MVGCGIGPGIGPALAAKNIGCRSAHQALTAFSPFLHNRSWRITLVILSLLTAVRVWAAAHAGLAPDETYYWLWSQTPALGYADHPPMVAWWIWLSTHVLGDTALGLRVTSILSVLITSLAIFGTARQLLMPQSIALRSVLWFNAMILIGIGSIFITPDSPSTMFWALTIWVLSAIWRTELGWLWLLVGLFAGLGCVSKYTNLFLGPGIVVWLLVDKRARCWLFSPWLWLGGLLAFVVFAPVILWNAEHGWISFYKQFGRLAVHGLRLRYLAELLLSQVGLANPLIAFFAALAATTIVTAQTRDADSRPQMLLIATMAPLVIYMVIHAFYDRVQANWLAPIYPQVAILAAAHSQDLGRKFRVRLARAVVPLGCAISVISLAYLSTPIRLPFPNPGDRLEGWEKFAADIERVGRQSGASWIATVNYDVNAELSFYEGGHQPVRQIVERERYSSGPLDHLLPAQQAVLVMSETEKASGRFDHCFAIVQPIALVSRRSGDRVVDRYLVERALTAPADILSDGCHVTSAKSPSTIGKSDSSDLGAYDTRSRKPLSAFASSLSMTGLPLLTVNGFFDK